jgi:hypothetical protein
MLEHGRVRMFKWIQFYPSACSFGSFVGMDSEGHVMRNRLHAMDSAKRVLRGLYNGFRDIPIGCRLTLAESKQTSLTPRTNSPSTRTKIIQFKWVYWHLELPLHGKKLPNTQTTSASTVSHSF